MLSLSKILFTVVIVFIVWKGMKFLSAKGQGMQVREAEKARQRQAAEQNARQNHPASGHGKGETTELVRCPKCGVYHAEGSSHICED